MQDATGEMKQSAGMPVPGASKKQIYVTIKILSLYAIMLLIRAEMPFAPGKQILGEAIASRAVTI